MKIEFSQTIGTEHREKKVVGTAQMVGGRLLCTGKGEKFIDAILHGERDVREVNKALKKATIAFNSDSLRAELVGD